MSSPPTLSQNEVIISGVSIVSGGQTFPDETVIIPVTGSASAFYVRDYTTGTQIQVDQATAAQLYATAQAINLLNAYYSSPLNVNELPTGDWAQEFDSAAQVASDTVGADFLENVIGQTVGLLVSDGTTLLSIAENVASAFETLASENSGLSSNTAELTITDAVLNSASALLTSSYAAYQESIYDDMPHAGGITNVGVDQPIDFQTIQNTVFDTLLSVNTGFAAADAFSDLNITGSLQQDFAALAHTIITSIFPGIPGEVIGDLSGIAGYLQETQSAYSSVTQLTQLLPELVESAQSTAQSSSPFSSTAIANDEASLASSPAVTQGVVLGQGGGSGGGSGTVAPTPKFSIISSPTIGENAGKIVFTIVEMGALSQNLTIYPSTIQNWMGSGIYNTSTSGSDVSTNYYYDGLDSYPLITFAATSQSSSSQQISVAINPVGLASGSETFGFEIQEMDSSGQLYTVESAPFTIVNQASTTSAPTISSVTSSVSGGSVLSPGRSVTFTVSFSESVTVNLAGGPPLLTLNDNETASYTGGSGTSTLTFVYNVSPGDQAGDLQVTGLTIPNGSGIAGLAGTAAVTTGATVNTGIQINTAAPTVAITTTGGLVGSLAQTVSGTVDVTDVGTKVTIFDGANNIGSATAASNGVWTANVTLSVTGSNTIVAKDTNGAGNTGVSNSIVYTVDTASYTLAPVNPVAQENQGSLVFTLMRIGDTGADTVFVQTDDTHGSQNPNSEYFQEQNLVPVVFGQYTDTATFAIPINDIHATSGNQTFGVTIYPSLNTSIGSLAATTFTIDDTDTNTGLLTGSIESGDTVTGTTTISSVVYIEAKNSQTPDVLQNDGVIDIDSGGSIAGDNDYGTVSNQAGSVININTADPSAWVIDVNGVVNDGVINALPGSGNVATIWIENGGFNDSGNISVLSGTLQLFIATGAATLNASGISVAASAALEFEGGNFTVAGGTYNVAGSTIIGNSTYEANVVFGAGTNVNIGGNWVLADGSLDFSAATLSGTFSSLSLAPDAYSLNFGSHNVAINDFNSYDILISDSGIVTLSGTVTSGATWSGSGTVINEGAITSPIGQPSEITSDETFINYGVANNLLIDPGAIFDNEAGATLNLANFNSVSGDFDNYGVINLGGDGVHNSQVSGVLNNAGTIHFSTAAGWTLNDGGTSNASSLIIDPNITLYFGGSAAADTFTITGGTFSGGGNLWIVSGAKVKFSASTQVDIGFHNDGTVELANGALTLEQALTGTGTVVMDAATTLALAAPQGFTNSISGFSSGDSIDLIGTAVTNASINESDQLVITDAGVTVATLQMIGDYPGTGLQFLLASDGVGGTTITLGVPGAPSVSAGAVARFADSASPTAVILDGAVTVIGGGSSTLASAAVSVSSGLLAGDILTATTAGTNIAASYNASNGVLTLSGNDTLANYETVLQSVTFNSVSNAQANGADPVRAISWTVNDGTRTSAAAYSTVAIAAAPPTVTALATPTFEVDVSTPVSLDPTLVVSDIDANTLAGATVSIGFGFDSGDVLGVTTTGTAIAVASNTGGVLTLAGTDTLQDYQTVLRSVTFSTTNPTSNSRVIIWSVGEGQIASTLTTSSVTVTSPPPPPRPVLTPGAPSVTFTAGGSPVTLDSMLGITDPESTTLANATVQVTGGTFAGDGDMLSGSTSGTSITATYDSATETLILFGTDTLAHYQSVLDQVMFTPGSQNPTNSGADPTRTVSWTVNDGTNFSTAVTTTVSIASNAPPPSPPAPPPPTAPGTTAAMIMCDGNNGDYEIYDIGGNAILAAGYLGQVGPEWQVGGFGGFNGAGTSDMILRDGINGALEIYDISNNAITFATAMGQVGLEWQFAGFGDFSSRSGETDMLMRNGNSGQFEIYDIGNNAITFATAMGQVGLEWQVAGFGDFSTRANESDMLMRNSNTGQFELYDISNNAITVATSMGQVGLEWSIAGFGDFSGNANETDMLMRNSNTGQFEIYDISNNRITLAAGMGQVGLEWQVAGFGPLNGAGSSDMLMRNSTTGAFEYYDISNNQLTTAGTMGQVGPEWSVAGIAADPPGSSSSAAQLTQTLASFAPADPPASGVITSAGAGPQVAGTSPLLVPVQSPLA
ncbi:MAG: hypothetical protein WA268_14575 [Xanthobacteraceae bacterium]